MKAGDRVHFLRRDGVWSRGRILADFEDRFWVLDFGTGYASPYPKNSSAVCPLGTPIPRGEPYVDFPARTLGRRLIAAKWTTKLQVGFAWFKADDFEPDPELADEQVNDYVWSDPPPVKPAIGLDVYIFLDRHNKRRFCGWIRAQIASIEIGRLTLLVEHDNKSATFTIDPKQVSIWPTDPRPSGLLQAVETTELQERVVDVVKLDDGRTEYRLGSGKTVTPDQVRKIELSTEARLAIFEGGKIENKYGWHT